METVTVKMWGSVITGGSCGGGFWHGCACVRMWGAVYGLCVRSSAGWGRCGQVSGSGINTGRKAPGKLGVVEAET